MKYDFTTNNDKTIKQFMERFYVLPKQDEDGKPYKYTKEELKIIEKYALELIKDNVKEGKDGYIVFRGIKPKKLNENQCEEIKNSDLSYRKLAEKYNVSVGTIFKVKNNLY